MSKSNETNTGARCARVIFFHGYPGHSSDFIDIAEAIDGECDIFEMPWVGLDSPYMSMTQIVAALDIDLGDDDVHLVGHDLGAVIAWRLAQGTRRKVLSLTLMSIPRLDAYVEQFHCLDDGGYLEYQRQLIDHFVGAPLPALELLVDAEKNEPTASQRLAFNRLMSSPTQIVGLYRDLHSSSNPIKGTQTMPPLHMLFGNEDPYFPQSLLLDARSTSDEPVTVTTINSGGHWPHYTHGAECMDAIISFIEANHE